MSCRNCYKYPFCEKCNSPKGYPLYYENGKQKCNCTDFKKKRIEMEKKQMNLGDEEIEKTKSVKRVYDVVYRNMEYYIDRYNEIENDIQENYYSKDKILKALGIEYREQDLSEDRICSLIESLLKEKHRVEKENEELKKQIQFRVDYCNKLEKELFKPKVDLDKYEITIPLEDKGLENIEYYYKKGDKWYAHYKETQVDKTKVKELEEQAKSKVIEEELKEMILGMLE